MSKFAAFVFGIWLLSSVQAKPAELHSNHNENEVIPYNSFPSRTNWTKYNIATVTTAALVITAGLALLTTLFYPIYLYKICYYLGGCQNTLDNYVDRFLGLDTQIRRIKKRDVRGETDMTFVVNLLSKALQEYGTKPSEQQNSALSDQDHQIGKRSPIDYIEPIMVMASKAYNEYVDPELKKNFKKPPSIR